MSKSEDKKKENALTIKPKAQCDEEQVTEREFKGYIRRLLAVMGELIKRKKYYEILVYRRYKKSEGSKEKRAKHPKLIIEVTDDSYIFMGFTESPKKGRQNNIKLSKNPKEGDPRPAYIRKEVKQDYQGNFGKILKDYNLPEEDFEAVMQYLENRKKK